MDTFLNRVKVTSITWLIATIIGSFLISLDANKGLVVVSALLGFTLSYYYFVVREVTIKRTIITVEKSRDSNLEKIKDRALQLYQFNEAWALKYSNKRVESAYIQALLRTIDEDELYQGELTSHFSELFKSYLTTFDTVYRKSYLSIDEVMIDLQKKEKQTYLQTEFLDYLSSTILKSLEVKNIVDIQLIYRVENEHLIVKKAFANWFGIKIASFIRAIDSNKEQLGLSEVIGLRLPPPNKSSQQDDN